MSFAIALLKFASSRPAGRVRLQPALLSLLCVLGLLALFPKPAQAHPMGNFSINRYSRLTVSLDQVGLLYIVDMAEIPTHAERTAMDADADGAISIQEEQRYLESRVAALPAQLTLVLDGAPAHWTPVARRLTFPPGQAGLPTLRMELEFMAPLSGEGQAHTLAYADANYAGRLGWQEVVVAAAEGIELLAADVPQSDLSDALRAYPVDLLQEPPAVHSAALRWRAATGQARERIGQAAAPAGAVVTRQGQDRLAKLVALRDLGPWQVTLALLGAFVWGAAHALSPGHGKTIVAAYLVGTRGTWRHAAFLGATTTITHTIGVFALGVATLLASEVILPERIYPWLSTLSGCLVVAIGLSLGWSRLRSLRAGAVAYHHSHADHAHERIHDEAQFPAHSHAHPHEHEPGHDHTHSHDSAHTHHHGLERHHGHAHHHHGGHSHLPPGADGRALTWRSLLALGISGGLLPCPSALVVLLGAVALERIGFGLLLILVFSLGLASVLTAIGLMLLYAGRLFERIPQSGRYARHLAVASAAFIVLLGAGITLRALLETGLLAGILPV